MSYKDETIKDAMEQIYDNKIYLPAIQRKFVWDTDQIISLFDSLMMGYPIGTFLFWKLTGKNEIKQYTFYSFILHFHTRDNSINKTTAKPEHKDEIIGVLDGQQRLSSMFVALKGTYSFKKPYARWDDDEAFPQRYLCINLLYRHDGIKEEEEEEVINYQFEFLTKDELETSKKGEFWFPVRKVLEWKNVSDCTKYASEKKYIENDIFTENLTVLWSRFTQEKLINYFEIIHTDIEDVLPIFVRINSGGTPLSKTDLLFSTIVANWEEGRGEIEALLSTINKKGQGFNFSNDFIMRSCLTLTNCRVLFKVKNFKRENIQKIKINWKGIKNAIIKSVDLLNEFGFSNENLTSQMAVVVIAYYIFNNGVINRDSKAEIRKYLILSLLNRIYGGQPDQIITLIREGLKSNSNKFELIKINKKLDSDKKLSISYERLEEILSESKGAYTFMVLSLLYPNLKLDQVIFHQDHIHPTAMFNKKTLIKDGLIEASDTQKYFYLWNLKDKLPNLQLLEGSENESKNDIPFKDWFEINVSDKKKYKKDNYIPNVISLNFSEFEIFYEKRKELLKNRLMEILKI